MGLVSQRWGSSQRLCTFIFWGFAQNVKQWVNICLTKGNSINLHYPLFVIYGILNFIRLIHVQLISLIAQTRAFDRKLENPLLQCLGRTQHILFVNTYCTCHAGSISYPLKGQPILTHIFQICWFSHHFSRCYF